MGRRLKMLKTRDVIRALSAMGFQTVRQSGSHIFMMHRDGRATVVPSHGGEDIGRGLLRQILRDIEVSPEEFLTYL